jgi:hypothetical protein
MLEEINKVAREIDVEKRELEDLRSRQSQDQSGPLDVPIGPPGGGIPLPPTGGGAGPTPAPTP